MTAETQPMSDAEGAVAAAYDHVRGQATEEESREPHDHAQLFAREAWRLGQRWRLQLLPLAGVGATHAVGAAAASMGTPEAMLPIAVGWGGAVGGYVYAHRHSGRWGRVYAGIAAVGSAMFQAGLAFAGGEGMLAAMLWSCGCALSLPWWVRHSEPDPDVTAEHEALSALPTVSKALEAATERSEPVEAAARDPRVRLWEENIAAPRRKAPGSQLTELRDFEYGWKATVVVPRPRNWSEVFNARAQIESTYDLESQRAVVESIRGRDVKYCQLTVLERDPLEQVTEYKGIGLDPEKGSFPVMVTMDGQLLDFPLWVPGEGGSHALISGGSRSGKSTLLKLVTTECGASPIVHPLIIDGAGGASLAHWAGNGEYASTLKDAKELMRYAIDLAEKRNPALIEQIHAGGPESINPSTEHPLLPVIVDEAHEFLMADRKFVRLCERFAQKEAKYAGSLILSTQVPSVEQLGGSTALRGQLKMGTVIGLRITEGSNQGMIQVGDPMPESLRNLPAEFPDGSKTRGLGYMMTGRKIRSRVIYLANPQRFPCVEAPFEPALQVVPKPVLTGEEDPETGASGSRSSAELNDSGDVDAVIHALAEGCPENAGNLSQATGLSLRRVMAAMKSLD